MCVFGVSKQNVTQAGNRDTKHGNDSRSVVLLDARHTHTFLPHIRGHQWFENNTIRSAGERNECRDASSSASDSVISDSRREKGETE